MTDNMEKNAGVSEEETPKVEEIETEVNEEEAVGEEKTSRSDKKKTKK